MSTPFMSPQQEKFSAEGPAADAQSALQLYREFAVGVSASLPFFVWYEALTL